MGCFMCTRLCDRGVASKGSFDSLDSDDHGFRALTNTCQEGLYHVEDIKAPEKSEFDVPKFSSSAMVYMNNSRQRPDLNPFAHGVEKNPEVYFRYFPFLKVKESGGVYILETEISQETVKSKDSIDKIQKTDEFLKHLKITNKIINCLVGIAITDDLEMVEPHLIRIGAKHAELGIPAKHMHAFQESFLDYLQELIELDKITYEKWNLFIKYIINTIIHGMNEHYNKVLFVYWSVHRNHGIKCFSANCGGRPKVRGIDGDCMLSLRNMAATVEALQD
ncbi:hypothetical protein EGW08_000312 [Elysia chlorotica]|uniref:Globin n=1 Tax=Elysia chlorotica TaxID=188477 RepID=A0A3S1A6M3_ELYCH|nr:hypothetical protein EGW08_000312 [Elysia chlorotica]